MLRLLPTPKKHRIEEDVLLNLAYRVHTQDPEWKSCCDTLADTLFLLYDEMPEFGPGGIELVTDTTLPSEHYVIDAGTPLQIRASEPKGMLYGIASVIQITNLKNGIFQVPKLHIEDYPDKDYRSMMVDLARQWYPFPKLLKLVEICFLYKINYLNLHFMDSQAYTLPSRAFPKANKPGRYYTEEQIAQLNAYAKARGVTIVPEYECPGHAAVLVQNYPEQFGNNFGALVPEDMWDENGKVKYSRSLMCPGSTACLEANKTILKEISDLFPDSPYLHIGGDEVNIELWDYCDDCRAYMRENGITGIYDLYSEFIGRIAAYVLTLGKTPIVWEGFPVTGSDRIPKETIVSCFESQYHMPYELINEGFRVINSSWKPLYSVCHLNRRWSVFDILAWNVYNWQSPFPSSEAYLNPITVAPTEQVLGSTYCVWERTYERQIHFILERLIAMSERVWTLRRVCPDEDFEKLLCWLLEKVERIIQDK